MKIDSEKRPNYTSLTEVEVERSILHYKGIYILNNICNIAFGSLFILFGKLCISFMMILSFFACVRAYKYLDYTSYTFLIVTVIACLFFLVPMLIIMSSLYDISKNLSRSLSPQISNMRDKKSKKVLEAQLKSCIVIRCRVGNLYYMEAKAKLTAFHNIVNGIVFLLVNVKV